MAEWTNSSGVYAITSPSGAVYVGSATCFRRRWAQHRHKLRSGKHSNPILQAAYNKHGEALQFSVLLVCQKEHAVMYEQIAMNALEPSMNVLKVAGSRLGAKQSSEARAKMSAAKAGSRHSEEARRKISEAGTGRTHSAESKALMSDKLRAAWARRKASGVELISEEWRKKISAARAGAKMSEESKQKVREARLAYWAERKLSV